MEQFVVVGICHSSGEYNGNPYDNYVFHCLQPADESKGQTGSLCVVLKVKVSAVVELPKVGDTVRPTYDRYGRVVSIDIV